MSSYDTRGRSKDELPDGSKISPNDEGLRLADEIINLREAADGSNDLALYEQLLKKLDQLDNYCNPGNESTRIWNESGELSAKDFAGVFKRLDGAINFARCSPGESLVACGGPDGNVLLLDPGRLDGEKWMRSEIFSHETAVPNVAAFATDGSSLALGRDDGKIRVYSAKERGDDGTAKLLAEYKAGEPISALAFSPDGAFLIAGGKAGYLAVLKLPTGGPGFLGRMFNGPVPRLEMEYDLKVAAPVGAVAWSPDQRLFVAGLANGRVHAFSTEVRDHLGKPGRLASFRVEDAIPVEDSVEPRLRGIRTLSFSSCARFLLAGGAGGNLEVREIGPYRLSDSKLRLGTRIAYDAAIDSAAFSPQADRIVVAAGRKLDVLSFTGKLHERAPIRRLASYESTSVFTSASFTPDSKVCASTTSGVVMVFAPSN